MTEKELERKAFEYRREVVPETYLCYPDVEIPMYSALDIDRAYLAGAKELQKENVRLKFLICVLVDEINALWDINEIDEDVRKCVEEIKMKS
jgi:hypothetical protein